MQSGNPNNSSVQTAIPVSICFFALGFLSFWATCATLFRTPEFLLGEPYQPEVLALTHLFVLGWISSLIFGAGYMILPVMASTRLWSLRMAAVHLALHAIGLPWMLAGFLWMDFTEAGHGGSLVFAGIILFVINLLLTASQRNRWNPPQITVVSALFWLTATAFLAILMLVNKYIPIFKFDAQWLIAMHSHMGLLGFLWLLLLGSTLKLFSMFLISKHSPGFFSWAGCLIFNLGLLMMIPGELYAQGTQRKVMIAALLIGSLCYLVDIARILLGSNRKADWSIWTTVIGLLTGVGVMAWVAAGAPTPWASEPFATRDLIRTYFILALFGPFTLAIFGMGTRIIPFLVWQLKYASLAGTPGLPTVQDLRRSYSIWAVGLSFTAGWIFMLLGLLLGDVAALQIGILLMLIGTGWFFYSISPALFAILSATPTAPVTQSNHPS